MNLANLPPALLRQVQAFAIDGAHTLDTHRSLSLTCKAIHSVVTPLWYESIDVAMSRRTCLCLLRTLKETGYAKYTMNLAFENIFDMDMNENDATAALLKILHVCSKVQNLVIGSFTLQTDLLDSCTKTFPSVQRLTFYDMAMNQSTFQFISRFPSLELLMMGSIRLEDGPDKNLQLSPTNVKGLKLDLCIPMEAAVNHPSNSFPIVFSNLRFLTVKSHDIADTASVIQPTFATNLVTLHISITDRFLSTSQALHEENHICPYVSERLSESYTLQHLTIDGAGAQICSKMFDGDCSSLHVLRVGPVHSDEICDEDPFSLRDILVEVARNGCYVDVSVLQYGGLVRGQNGNVQYAADEFIDEWALARRGSYGTRIFPIKDPEDSGVDGVTADISSAAIE